MFNNKKLNCISLFDGIAGGLTALKMAGFKIESYRAFEIESNAIEIAKNNHPEIEHLGCVKDALNYNFKGVDILFAGTECQSYSVAGKMDASDFWQIELVKDCLDKLKPKFFLIENVKSKKAIINRISETLEVEPILINAADFSAQRRERYYWTNIPILHYQPSKLNLYDICDNKDDLPLCYSSSGRGANGVERRISDNSKAHTLTKTGYSNRAFSGYITKKREIRNFSIRELERLQGLPEGYCDGYSYSIIKQVIGNGWNINKITHILQGIKQC